MFQGNSTSVTKLGLEAYLSYNMGTINDVGKYVSAGSGSGTYTADPGGYTLAQAGEDLMIRVTAPIESTSDMVVTVTGTNAQGGGALTGTCTIKSQVSEGQAYQVITTASAKFATVTNVTATNGVLGDGFQLCTQPVYANDVEIGFCESVNLDEGTELKTIYKHYDKDHDKRIRGEKKLTITSLYRSHMLDLSRINGRDVVIRVDIRDDGGNSPSEIWLVDKCRMMVKKSIGSGEESIKENGEGSFGRKFIFS